MAIHFGIGVRYKKETGRRLTTTQVVIIALLAVFAIFALVLAAI